MLNKIKTHSVKLGNLMNSKRALSNQSLNLDFSLNIASDYKLLSVDIDEVNININIVVDNTNLETSKVKFYLYEENQVLNNIDKLEFLTTVTGKDKRFFMFRELLSDVKIEDKKDLIGELMELTKDTNDKVDDIYSNVNKLLELNNKPIKGNHVSEG